jgi:hypothetical protein
MLPLTNNLDVFIWTEYELASWRISNACHQSHRAIAFEMYPVKPVILSERRERRIPFESTIQPYQRYSSSLCSYSETWQVSITRNDAPRHGRLRMTFKRELESKCDCPVNLISTLGLNSTLHSGRHQPDVVNVFPCPFSLIARTLKTFTSWVHLNGKHHPQLDGERSIRD